MPKILTVFGRFAEAVVLVVSTSRLRKLKHNQWLSLGITLVSASGASLALLGFYPMISALLTGAAVTAVAIVTECITIGLFITVLLKILTKFNKKRMILYKYTCMAVMFAIPAELCFIASDRMGPLGDVCGHILKAVFYFYILKGVFTGGILYPYNALKIKNGRLRETNHGLKDILNGLPLALVNYDNKKRISFANKKAFELLECRHEDIIGKTVEQLRGKLSQDASGVLKLALKNSDTIIAVRSEYKMLKDREISLNINAFQYKGGVLVSLIDARKDQELSDLKIQTRTILNAISNNVIITDTSFKIIMFNKAFKLCIEMRDGDILGRNLNSLYHELKLTADGVPYKALTNIQRNEKFVEAALETPRGNKKVILLNYNPIFNVKDELIGYIFVSSDITEIKKEQQKALQQEKLAIIGQMGSGIVHETKNHLALIKGYCQLLEQKLTDERLQKYIDRIKAISEDVNGVIMDFLILAKPSETSMDIISLNETIDNMRYMLESPSFVGQTETNIVLCENDKDIKGDKTKIKQVILNMAKNAIEAMSEVDKPVLNIVTEVWEEGNVMRLIISDNGKGISKEDMKKIGSLFFTTKENGTGLGLNLCYKIIEEHAGSIEVRSEENEGATFIISIPFLQDERIN